MTSCQTVSDHNLPAAVSEILTHSPTISFQLSAKIQPLHTSWFSQNRTISWEQLVCQNPISWSHLHPCLPYSLRPPRPPTFVHCFRSSSPFCSFFVQDLLVHSKQAATTLWRIKDRPLQLQSSFQAATLLPTFIFKLAHWHVANDTQMILSYELTVFKSILTSFSFLQPLSST